MGGAVLFLYVSSVILGMICAVMDCDVILSSWLLPLLILWTVIR